LLPATGEDAVADRVWPVLKREFEQAAELLFQSYSSSPEFAQLYNLAPGRELDGTRQIFRGLLRTMAHLPGTILGHYRGGKLVGVGIYCPQTPTPIIRLLAAHPFAVGRALIRNACIEWRCKPPFGPQARVRWRTYCLLARTQTPRRHCLHVFALGVAPAAQRTGVARRLLAAMEEEGRRRWPRFSCIVVDTWHAANVAIYERLGFTTSVHGTRDGIECWTMTREVAPTA
jgi:ribosomal protein S18 acetylase RimI-like enzyme